MINKSSLLILLFLSIFISSCNKEAEIPSYIYIEDIDLQTEGNEGSSRDNITDVWLSIDGINIGVFALPCSIPVVTEGESKIKVRAGINLNGIEASKTDYFAYQDCLIKDANGTINSTVNLVKDSVVQVFPTAKYKTDISIKALEDFESAGISLESIEFKDTSLVDSIYSSDLIKTNENVYEGDFSGKIKLTKAKNFIYLATTSTIDVPVLNIPNFIELDYKTDVPLEFGIWYANSAQTNYAMGGIKPTKDWKKVIFSVTPEAVKSVNANIPHATQYKIYIKSTLPKDMDEATIYIDNFKLIHGKNE